MVLETCSTDDLYGVEQRNIATFRAIYPDLLNLADKGPGPFGCRSTKEQIATRVLGVRRSWHGDAGIRIIDSVRSYLAKHAPPKVKRQSHVVFTQEMREKRSRSQLKRWAMIRRNRLEFDDAV